MQQRNIEKYAFLYLCGKRDRDLLLGKEKMTFLDLDRLAYITDFLGLSKLNLELWNQYGGQFREQIREMEKLYDETSSIAPWDPAEADWRLQEQWVKEFCRQIPDRHSRKQIEELIRLKVTVRP